AEFVRRGHEVHLVVSRIGRHFPLPSEVRVHHLRTWSWNKKKQRIRFSQQVQHLLRRTHFDLSFSLGRTAGQDVVLAPANHLGFKRAEGQVPNQWRDQVQIQLDRDSFTSSRLVLAASHMMKEELIELYGISSEKIEVLYPPIDIKKFTRLPPARRQDLRNQWGLSAEKRYFLFVSTSHKRKGLPLLLDVFSRLTDLPYELLICGKPLVQTDLPNVRYLGHHSQVEELYNCCDYTIHPAQYEPFGQIVVESLQCGCPVLVSERVGAKEILNESLGRVVPGFEAQTWALCIRSLVDTRFAVPVDFALIEKLDTQSHVTKLLALLAQHGIIEGRRNSNHLGETPRPNQAH
ncbi:MAG: glycosyltransferase family 4 protein, partial [Cytophagales bacterium]|nr:glycosyltransferase family 4 protein [Cytophagales bacterium]